MSIPSSNQSQISGIRANNDILTFAEEVKAQELYNTKVKGRFLLITYTNDRNREDEFLEWLIENLPIYALPKEERIKKKYSIQEGVRLTRQAFKKFAKNAKTGELGEVILFYLLEVFEGAVQIVNKMPLKTSQNMYVNGADAIHFKADGNLRILYLGESKTGESFSRVLEDSFHDTDEYYKGGKMRFDIDLATGHLSTDILKQDRDMIKEYLNPFKKDLSKLAHVHAVFLGYHYKALSDFEGQLSGEELKNKVIEQYGKDIEKYLKSIEDKFDNYPKLKDKQFLFFVVPFKDLESLRKKFVKVIEGGG